MDVDKAVDHLYALPAEEFVAARNSLAKQLKADGDAKAATAVKTLRKPTLAAWLINQLARRHSAVVADLVGLGEHMRRATTALDGSRLRELTAQRKELVDALHRHARELAEDNDVRLADDVVTTVDETLVAAMADPDAAAALQAARLSRGLHNVGFGPVPDSAEIISLTEAREAREQRAAEAETRAARAKAAESNATEQAAAEREAERQSDRDAAERDLADAEAAVETADERVDDLEAALDERRQRLADAEQSTERLADELAAARAALDQARSDVKAGQRDVQQARDDAEQARRQRREARRHLGTLSQ